MKNFIKGIREKRRISINEVADKLKMTYQNASDIEKNKVMLSSKYISPLCEILNCTISELFGEKEYSEKNTEIIQLKYYENIYASAGNGCFNDTTETYEYFNFDKEFLNKINIVNNYHNIAIIKATGDSMYPTINSNDLLFVDISKKEIRNNNIYVLNENDVLKVKRIIKDTPFSTDLTIMSDNSFYKSYILDFERTQALICGQVIYYGRNIL